MTQPAFATPEVLDPSPPFTDINLYSNDQPLIDAVRANGGLSAEWTGVSTPPTSEPCWSMPCRD